MRSFRIPDEVFEAARLRAEAEGVTLTDVVRRLLEEYVAASETV